MKSLYQRLITCWQGSKRVARGHSKTLSAVSNEKLDAIIIENSAKCNLRCEACPTVYAKNYPMQAMSMETFYRVCAHISPDIFPKCGLIGWGEPFLDPGYFEKLRHLKKGGYIVGSTSNFVGLTERVAHNVIDNGLDHLNISVDSMHFNTSGIFLPG